MINNFNLHEHPVAYTLSIPEVKTLHKLILTDKKSFKYSHFIIYLLKVFNYDVVSIIRLINVGNYDKNSRVFPAYLLKKFLIYVREAIILTNYDKYLVDGLVSPSRLAKLERFKDIGINRNLINRVLKKHTIYNKVRS